MGDNIPNDDLQEHQLKKNKNNNNKQQFKVDNYALAYRKCIWICKTCNYSKNKDTANKCEICFSLAPKTKFGFEYRGAYYLCKIIKAKGRDTFTDQLYFYSLTNPNLLLASKINPSTINNNNNNNAIDDANHTVDGTDNNNNNNNNNNQKMVLTVPKTEKQLDEIIAFQNNSSSRPNSHQESNNKPTSANATQNNNVNVNVNNVSNSNKLIHNTPSLSYLNGNTGTTTTAGTAGGYGRPTTTNTNESVDPPEPISEELAGPVMFTMMLDNGSTYLQDRIDATLEKFKLVMDRQEESLKEKLMKNNGPNMNDNNKISENDNDNDNDDDETDHETDHFDMNNSHDEEDGSDKNDDDDETDDFDNNMGNIGNMMDIDQLMNQNNESSEQERKAQQEKRRKNRLSSRSILKNQLKSDSVKEIIRKKRNPKPNNDDHDNENGTTPNGTTPRDKTPRDNDNNNNNTNDNNINTNNNNNNNNNNDDDDSFIDNNNGDGNDDDDETSSNFYLDDDAIMAAAIAAAKTGSSIHASILEISKKLYASEPVRRNLFRDIIDDANEEVYDPVRGVYMKKAHPFMKTLDTHPYERTFHGSEGSFNYIKSMLRERGVMQKKVNEEVDPIDESFDPLKSGQPVKIEGLLVEHEIQDQACACCEITYKPHNLLGRVPFQLVNKWRIKHKAPFDDNDMRLHYTRCYDTVKTCIFCFQFFDENFSQYLEYHRGRTNIKDKILLLEGDRREGSHLDLGVSLKLLEFTKTGQSSYEAHRPVSRLTHEMSLTSLRSRQNAPLKMAELGCELAKFSEVKETNVPKRLDMSKLLRDSRKNKLKGSKRSSSSGSRLSSSNSNSNNNNNNNSNNIAIIPPKPKSSSSLKKKPEVSVDNNNNSKKLQGLDDNNNSNEKKIYGNKKNIKSSSKKQLLPKVKPPARKRTKKIIPKDDLGRRPWNNSWDSEYEIYGANAIPHKSHIPPGKFKNPIIIKSVTKEQEIQHKNLLRRAYVIKIK